MARGIRSKRWSEKPPVGAQLNLGHPLAQGIVGCWLFNENSGLRAYDLSGRGNTGTLTNGPTWSAGRRGRALNFDGVNDDVLAGTGSSLNITGNITIAAWIYPKSFGGGTKGRIFDKNDASPTVGYDLQLEDTTVNDGFAWVLGNGAASTSSNANVIQLNQWQHVVLSYNGSNCNFYVDGTSAGSPAFTTNSSSSSTITASIGGRASDTARQFDGLIDEVRIYNRALSSTEVRWLFTDPYACFVPPAPRLRYFIAAPPAAVVTAATVEDESFTFAMS